MFRVLITGPAKHDIEVAYEWWAKHRSPREAARWYLGIHNAIHSLSEMPQRCSLAPETDLLSQGVRQLFFGIGPRQTHRIVFSLDGNSVIVLRVRHTSQNLLAAANFTEC
jgi:plasmid stabilization system protein ParE